MAFSGWLLSGNLGQFRAHIGDDGVVAVRIRRPCRAENRGTGDERVGARFGDLADVVDLDAAIDFQADVVSTVIDQLARRADSFGKDGR